MIAGLDRLGPGIAEERAILARERAQSLGERDHGLAVEEVRDVTEHGRLLGQRLDGGGMAVAERVDREAADEVEVRVAVLVPDRAAGAAHERERPLRDTSAGSPPRLARAGSWRHHCPCHADPRS